MGGFELAGHKYVIKSSSVNAELCMCSGLYGFIDEIDEQILVENTTKRYYNSH